MTIHAQRTLRLRKILFALLLALICIAIIIGVNQNKQWNIPEKDKRRVNPIQPSREVINAARVIYLDKCSQCHGTSGKGDGPDAATYYPSPTNLTDASHINSVTDGEIFYQISQGSGSPKSSAGNSSFSFVLSPRMRHPITKLHFQNPCYRYILLARIQLARRTHAQNLV